MAATGSDQGGVRRAIRALPRRLGLRMRLTLLYGVCFLVGSGAVLTVTYLLIAHDTRSQTGQLYVHGVKIDLPSLPLTVVTRSGAGSASSGKSTTLLVAQIRISPNGTETITWTPSRSSGASEKATLSARYSAAQVSQNQAGALKMSQCMRAHGVSYPNLLVVYDRGHLEIGFPRDTLHLFSANLRAPAFREANVTCSRLLNSAFPLEGPALRQIASSVQSR